MRHRLIVLAIAILGALSVIACEPVEEEKSADRTEQQKQTETYESLVETQPARGMSYSPSRDTANHWAETWEEEGKLSYVYLIDSVGHHIGYYIFRGLPVSYCASLTPPDKVDKTWYSGYGVTAVTRSAPAIDGMYYANANCDQLYGYDAVSGAYMEFTGGGSFNYLLSDQPMTKVDSQPLGDATVENVENKK